MVVLGSVLVVSHTAFGKSGIGRSKVTNGVEGPDVHVQGSGDRRRSLSKQSIRPADFFRDVSTFIVLFAFIIAVCFDGKVTLWESTLVVGIYVIYIAIAIFVARRAYKAMRAAEKTPLLDKHMQPLLEWNADIIELDGVFVGLNWPRDAKWYTKVQHVIEYPFSVLRWLSIPSADQVWGPRRRTATVLCPPFALMIMMLAWGGRSSFTVYVGALPLWAMLVIFGGWRCACVRACGRK